MDQIYPVSRNTTLWLLAAQVMVLLPLWNIVPFPLIALGAVATAWRIAIWFGRGQYPPSWLRVSLVLASALIVGVSFRPLISLDSAVSILAAGYSLKLLEMRQQRDALVVTYIGFFVVAASVLFFQSLLQTLYLLLCLVVLVAAQQGIYRRSSSAPVRKTLKYGFILAAQAIPLTVFLFILVPRIGPLWSVPLPDSSARTGMTDEMSPGDIARLSRSDELVFRATFSGEVPPPSERYWRGMVMDQFDGRTWRKSEPGWGEREAWITSDPVEQGWWKNRASPYEYDVMLEPTGRKWLFTLGTTGMPSENSLLIRTLRMESEKEINSRQLYSVSDQTPVPRSVTLPPWLRAINLKLPEQGDQQSRRYAQQLFAASGQDPLKMAGSLMANFRRQSFVYTLTPPLLGKNTIDEFLFESRSGFCSHYAGAFTFLMRAAGVPARIVGGYQGGEYKEESNLIQVRQFDAHAWSEIWVEGEGWVRFDPTAAVSPDRIEMGLESALGETEAFLEDAPLSIYRYRDFGLLNQVRLTFERLEYQWQRSVINYNNERQESFLRNLLGSENFYWRQALAFAGGILLVLSLMAFLLLYQRRQEDPLHKLYRVYCRKMAKHGFSRQPGEGEATFAQRIQQSDLPVAERAVAFSKSWQALAYQKECVVAEDIKRLKKLLRSL